MVRRFPSGSRFVEIGSFHGTSLAHLVVEAINSGKEMDVTAVDLFGLEWQYANTYPTLFEDFTRYTAPIAGKFKVLRMRSVEAAKTFADKSLDFVFVDATHSYEGCRDDIAAFLPKMKPGGVMGGHDYSWPGVQQATREAFGDRVHGTPPAPAGQDVWWVDIV